MQTSASPLLVCHISGPLEAVEPGPVLFVKDIQKQITLALILRWGVGYLCCERVVCLCNSGLAIYGTREGRVERAGIKIGVAVYI